MDASSWLILSLPNIHNFPIFFLKRNLALYTHYSLEVQGFRTSWRSLFVVPWLAQPLRNTIAELWARHNVIPSVDWLGVYTYFC